MTGGEDRLSALGDDLLLRILYFTPAKEAASTSLLSRRWGSLWRSSGAVNLAVRVPEDGSGYRYRDRRRKAFFSHRDAFVRAADAALAAAASAPVKRLTLRLEGNNEEMYSKFLHEDRDWRSCQRHDVVGAVVSHPAARLVEELRIAAVEDSDEDYPTYETCRHRGIYILGFLPSETLRVLDLTRCCDLTLPEDVAFPQLATLRLRLCTVQTEILRSLMDTAPELATVHLGSVHFRAPRQSGNSYYQQDSDEDDNATTADQLPTLRLRCLAATKLELAWCNFDGGGENSIWAIEIEAPRLRSFTYKGNSRSFLLRTPARDMVHLDLYFLKDEDHKYYHIDEEDPTRMHFWQFVQNFSHARVLKMKVNNLERIAAIGRAGRAKHLCLFPNVERLELEGVHDPKSKKAAVAIANLLRCCPALRDLQLKLSSVASDSDKDSNYVEPFLERKDRLDYEKSLDRFRRRRSSKLMTSMNDQDDREVSDIPGLRGRAFTCLQSSLRRVGLQFRLDGANSFGVRLIKFFAENAMVLEELYIDSGNRRLLEHKNLNIERWITPNSSKAYLKCKDLSEFSLQFSRSVKVSADSVIDLKKSTSGFTVTPLQR